MVMDNQGPGQDMPHGHSSLNNHLHPPPPIDPNPPPDTSILLQSNYMESPPTLAQNQTNQLPHAITDNETNQVPDAITDTTQANQISDTKTDTTPIQVIHAKTDTEPHQLPDFVTYTKLPDTKTDIKAILVPDTKTDTKIETQAKQLPDCKADIEADTVNSLSLNSKLNANPKSEPSSQANETKHEPATPKPNASSPDIASENVNGRELKPEVNKTELPTPTMNVNSNTRDSFLLDEDYEGSESGTEEEQSAFMKELENFFRENGMEFKPPKFYGEGLNCLKLWRAVTRLGGYDKVTSCKLWRQVGEAFKPPKTCTTVSWTFRGFYEKALLDYERHKTSGGDLSHLTLTVASQPEPTNIHNQASGSGRARRDAAARAMQGWHSQRVLGNGEVGDPIIKDKNSLSLQKREKQLKSLGLLKRKKSPYMEHAIVKAQRTKPSNPQLDVAVVDIGQPADWVKINVQRNKDCFEIYALVPGLLREEVRVQSDPAGRLVISGAPENPDNPWGVTPFKKVVTLPARIDPHQTSAVVTLHGQLFVRVPFEASE